MTNIHEVADGICRINTSIVIEGGPGGFSFNQFLIVDDALLCGDLFTQGGAEHPAITESDILGPSEAFRHAMDYFSHTQNARTMFERLASAEPTKLACVHEWQHVEGRLYLLGCAWSLAIFSRVPKRRRG